jgi:hypothetical protein
MEPPIASPHDGRETEPHMTRYTIDLRSVDQVDVYQHPAPENPEAECADNPPIKRWGLPDIDTPISVTAIIATVPDPVHTHLAMEFDRRVDVLLQAASDNDYLTSFYWLPWKHQVGALKAAEASGDAEPGHDPERERQPGLIVLKSSDSRGGHYRAIYLFLIGDSPTEGVNGSQLQYCFTYEDELAQEINKRPQSQFFRGQDDHTAIIGPSFTGSAASLSAGVERAERSNNSSFDITGITSTQEAVDAFKLDSSVIAPRIQYRSFGDNFNYDKTTFENLLISSGFDCRRIAFLVEDNTALGNVEASVPKDSNDKCVNARNPLIIRFPREISLLRNAKGAGDQGDGETASSGTIPSPYLHLSLKDSSAHDTVPQFSRENTPLSQEAQLMTIARELQRDRIQYIVIKASNTLDQIFLAQFLHRDLPDARLVFLNADLLMEREIDNVPFVGAITITPYTLIGLGYNPKNPAPTRTFTESDSVSFYNATSYTIWKIVHENSPFTPQLPIKSVLKGYQSFVDPQRGPILHPALWATAIGTDGYYPLAIISPYASDSNNPQILPTICSSNAKPAIGLCPDDPKTPQNNANPSSIKTVTIYASLLWRVLCALICLFCLLHTLILCMADYRSLFTRDLDIRENDQPRLRSAYLWVGTVMLSLMAFVVAWPLLSLDLIVTVDPIDRFLGWAALAVGALNLLVTFLKTKGHIEWTNAMTGRSKGLNRIRYVYRRVRANVEFLIHCLALVTLIVLSFLWWYCCHRDQVALTNSPGQPSYALVGVCFSYRCIHPSSGVSPVVPVLFLLFAWYIWGFFQTRRLRFSKSGRPSLPGRLDDPRASRLFVPEENLGSHASSRSPCLYEDISGLFVTRLVLRRFTALLCRKSESQDKSKHRSTNQGKLSIQERRDIAKGLKPSPLPVAEIAVFITYAALLVYFSLFHNIHGLDHFLWSHPRLATPYELLVGLLFIPLITVALAGWLRMLFIWSSLSSGLLNRLESQPIRYAFDRLQGMGWMTMLRLGGLREQWRDMARSLESIRQILHQEDLKASLGTANLEELEGVSQSLLNTVDRLSAYAAGQSGSSTQQEQPPSSLVKEIKQLEDDFAKFGQKLLNWVLIPYWRDQRTGLVDSKEIEELPIKARHTQLHAGNPHVPLELHTGSGSAEPLYIQTAEEFLAIRYVSLIRAVLANMRYLMSFVSVCFVLAIVAWNSYPFQPRYEVDWFFTFLLIFLGGGIISVFAEMHRDPILSRITETNANELGLDFYIRIITFGAVPLLTWVAYQFPDIGNAIFKLLQPTLGVIK